MVRGRTKLLRTIMISLICSAAKLKGMVGVIDGARRACGATGVLTGQRNDLNPAGLDPVLGGGGREVHYPAGAVGGRTASESSSEPAVPRREETRTSRESMSL